MRQGTVISVSGAPKRELTDKPVSAELDQIMERGRFISATGRQRRVCTDLSDKYTVAVASPIISEGDIMAAWCFFGDSDQVLGEVEYKLAQTVSFPRQTDGGLIRQGHPEPDVPDCF